MVCCKRRLSVEVEADPEYQATTNIELSIQRRLPSVDPFLVEGEGEPQPSEPTTIPLPKMARRDLCGAMELEERESLEEGKDDVVGGGSVGAVGEGASVAAAESREEWTLGRVDTEELTLMTPPQQKAWSEAVHYKDNVVYVKDPADRLCKASCC
jgi:hypothetical protein